MSLPILCSIQDLAVARLQLTSMRPSLPRLLISWSGFTTSFCTRKRNYITRCVKAGQKSKIKKRQTSVWSHGLAATRASHLVFSSTEANLHWPAPEVCERNLFSRSLPVASRIAFADISQPVQPFLLVTQETHAKLKMRESERT
jgi:hypothetical protein